MAPDDSCSADMLVMTRWSNRNLAVPLSQLKPIGVDESTRQAIEDWHYWIARLLLLSYAALLKTHRETASHNSDRGIDLSERASTPRVLTSTLPSAHPTTSGRNSLLRPAVRGQAFRRRRPGP
jgi:Calcium binding